MAMLEFLSALLGHGGNAPTAFQATVGRAGRALHFPRAASGAVAPIKLRSDFDQLGEYVGTVATHHIPTPDRFDRNAASGEAQVGTKQIDMRDIVAEIGIAGRRLS